MHFPAIKFAQFGKKSYLCMLFRGACVRTLKGVACVAAVKGEKIKKQLTKLLTKIKS